MTFVVNIFDLITVVIGLIGIFIIIILLIIAALENNNIHRK